MTERTIIIDAILKVVVPLLIAILIPYLKGWIERSRDNKEFDLVMKIATGAVRSVADDLKTETGRIKKAEALSRLAEQIKSWGLKGFTLDELNHYVSTAYTEMIDQQIPEPLPVTLEPYPEEIQ